MELLDENLEASSQSQDLDKLIENGFEFNFGNYISQGFEIFMKDPGAFIGFGLLSVLIMIAAVFIPFGGLVVGPVLIAGSFIYSHKVCHEQSREFSDFFKGFNGKIFGQLILASLISGIFSALGVICFIIPGIYLLIAYKFSALIIIFCKPRVEFWDSMEFSRKLITKKWWSFFGLSIIAGLIAGSGVILLGVGVIVTAPIASCILYAAFADIVKPGSEALDYME